MSSFFRKKRSASPPPPLPSPQYPRFSVPGFLLNLYARVEQNEASCREVRLCHKALGKQDYQHLLIHMAYLLGCNNTFVSQFFLYQVEVAMEASVAIGNMLRSNRGIAGLSFHRMDATVLAAHLGKALVENSNVTSLTLFASTFARPQAFKSLMFCLESSRCNVTEFSLEGCHLDAESLQCLWSALSSNTMLAHVDFRDMRLTGSDVIKLCQALQNNHENCRILTLLLDKNWMQDDGCEAIAKWITTRQQQRPKPTSLREISLAYNNIETPGIQALAKALRPPQQQRPRRHAVRGAVVSTLNISGNALTTDDVTSLMHVLTLSTATARSSSSSSAVAKLVMEDCSLEDDAILQIAQSLLRMPQNGLNSLNVLGHVVSKPIGHILVDTLQSLTCSSLLDLQLDLEDDGQKVVVDFYMRLNRAGRYLMRLSHYNPGHQQDYHTRDNNENGDDDDDDDDDNDHQDNRSSAITAAEIPKSMPCSLWPLVLARPAKLELDLELSEYKSQPDIIFYILREMADLCHRHQPVRAIKTDDNDDDSELDVSSMYLSSSSSSLSLTGAPNNTPRKRKRSLRP